MEVLTTEPRKFREYSEFQPLPLKFEDKDETIALPVMSESQNV